MKWVRVSEILRYTIRTSVNWSVSQSVLECERSSFPKVPSFKNKSMCKSARVQVHLDRRQQLWWGWRPTWFQRAPFSLPHFHPAFSLSLFYCSFSLSPSFPWQRSLSVAEEQSPPHSWEGRIRTDHAACLHTSFHRSDWSDWWCHPRWSPTRLRSPDQSHRALYSTAAPLPRGQMERFNDNGILKRDLGNEGY